MLCTFELIMFELTCPEPAEILFNGHPVCAGHAHQLAPEIEGAGVDLDPRFAELPA